MPRPSPPIQPRKEPLQARAAFTVEAILDATVHILEGSEDGEFNTKQVAERAGVSIGSLYQYFPNKQALLAALMRRKLQKLERATAAACVEAPEQYPDAVLFVMRALVSAKLSDLQPALALNPVKQRADIQAIVREHVLAMGELLRGLVESRIGRPLSEPESERMQIAVEAVGGVFSGIVNHAPGRLAQADLPTVLAQMLIAALAI